MLIHKSAATLVHPPSIRHEDEPRNPTMARLYLFVAAGQTQTHTNTQCVVSGTTGVASLQMAGAAHTLPVVIQYVLYNSREQQALSWYIKQQRTDPVIHYRLHTHDLSLYQRQFLQHTLNQTSQIASGHVTDTGIQLQRHLHICLYRIPVIQSLVEKPDGQPVRRLINLSVCQAYGCAMSHAAVQVTGPPVQSASQPASQTPIHLLELQEV